MAKRASAPLLRQALLAWYRANRRDLPWRATSDPYAVWVSEVMLQQTRVDTVIPYYQRFLERWPDVHALAAADEQQVRAAWSGLGYYRRASAMLRAAAQVVRDHDGVFPRGVDALKKLPGFGRYTAGAVASIAHGEPAPAVDGNVQRTLARIYGIEGDVTAGPGSKAVWNHAAVLSNCDSPGDINQALIELGALTCKPKNPACMACPVRSECVANAEGKQSTIPRPRVRAKQKRVELTMLLAIRAGPAVLLERQRDDGLFGGLWCLPMLEGRLEPDAALDEAGSRYGFELDAGETAAEFEALLTHRRLVIRVVRARGAPAKVDGALRWAPLANLADYGIPTVTVRALKKSLTPDERAVATLRDRSNAGSRSD